MKSNKILKRVTGWLAGMLALAMVLTSLDPLFVYAEGRSYDVAPPVLESIELIPSKAEGLTTSDYVTVRLKAYDADKNLERIEVDIRCESETVGASSVWSLIWDADEDAGWGRLKKTGNENEYEGKFDLSDFPLDAYVAISDVTLVDKNGNRTTNTKSDGTNLVYNDASNNEGGRSL